MTTTRAQGATRSARARLVERDEYPSLGVEVTTVVPIGIVMGPPPRVLLRSGAAGARRTTPTLPVLKTVSLRVPVPVTEEPAGTVAHDPVEAIPHLEIVAAQVPRDIAGPEVVEPRATVAEVVEPDADGPGIVEPESTPILEPFLRVDPVVLVTEMQVRPAEPVPPVIDVLPDTPLLRRLPAARRRDGHAHPLPPVAETLASPEARRQAVELTRRTLLASRRRQMILSAAVIVVIAGLLIGTWRFAARADAAARPDWNQISATTRSTTPPSPSAATSAASATTSAAATQTPSATVAAPVVPANLPAVLTSGALWGQTLNGACDSHGVPRSKDEAAATITDYADCLDGVWGPIISGSGSSFRALTVKMFQDSTTSSCGSYSSSIVTVVYCPRDLTLYVSGKALEQARGDRFYAIELITYEYTHHVQNLTGVYEATFHAGWDATERSRRAQLNAHCLSFALITHVTGFDPTSADIAMFRAGWEGPGSAAYGSTESLKSWGEKGLAATTVGDCNTFSVPASAVS